MPGLQQLPVELLYELFLFSLNENLPHTSKFLHSVFKCAPYIIHAEYIVFRSLPTNDLPSKILQFPICTIPVLKAVIRVPHLSNLITKYSKSITKLPKRLFKFSHTTRPNRTRQQTTDQLSSPIPFIQFLTGEPLFPRPDLNYKNGYPLVKAVGAGCKPLVRFLLRNGASPEFKDALAVKVAIMRKDLTLVRMLIEPGYFGKEGGVVGGEGVEGEKIEKMGDRVQVDKEMLNAAFKAGAIDIAKYFMKEKGLVPSYKTILKTWPSDSG